MLQNEIASKLIQCNAMIENENKLYHLLQQTNAKTKAQKVKMQKLKSSSKSCKSLTKQYNDFTTCNKQYIHEVNAKFDGLWNEFQSKWMEWNARDVMVWFKYKTMKMNTDKNHTIQWDTVEEQLVSRNISGKFLGDFNNLVFEWIGIKDFVIVTHLIHSIAILKQNNGGKENANSDTPKEYLCPITKQIMRDPVMAFDGNCYDRIAIETYLKKHKKSPITGADADYLVVFPNNKIKAEIQRFVQQNNIIVQTQEGTKETAYI